MLPWDPLWRLRHVGYPVSPRGYRESEASWLEVIEQLESQGLTIPPKLAIGDGALGFWKAVAKKWPQTAQQRCWVHKTANVLNKVPKSVQPKVKAALLRIPRQRDRRFQTNVTAHSNGS